VNNDDDNHNGTNDVADPVAGSVSSVTGENDLIAVNLSLVNVAPTQMVTLAVSPPPGSPCGRIRKRVSPSFIQG
jgi:hypothetical protein